MCQFGLTGLFHLQRLVRCCFATSLADVVVDSTMSADNTESICSGGQDAEADRSELSSDEGTSIPAGHVPSRNHEACMILILQEVKRIKEGA